MLKFTRPYGRLDVWEFPVLQAFRQRCLDLEVTALNTGWEDTLIPLGLGLAGQAFEDQAMLDWAQRWAQYHLDVAYQHPDLASYSHQRSGEPNQGVFLTNYCGEWGCLMVFALNSQLTEAVRTVADHIIEGSIRLQDDIIAHGHWAPHPWVDTLYYSASPLARAYQQTNELRYAEEAIQQCLLHARFLRDDRTGCFFHEADLNTGQRPDWLWARGNGWVVMALADTLRYCPPELDGWDDILAIYRSLVTGLLRFQHSSGLWHIVPENAESYLETSGAIMIATGITIGIAQGWLDQSLTDYVYRTWWEVLSWINSQGVLMGCQTPAGIGGWDTHKLSQMGSRTYGTGSLLRLVAELRFAELI